MPASATVLLQCDNTRCINCAVADGLPSVCRCYTEKPPVENGQCTEFTPKKVRKVHNFNIGDKARVLLLGDREGKIGEIIAKELRKPGIYRYLVRFPDTGEVWDYYGDEIEPA